MVYTQTIVCSFVFLGKKIFICYSDAPSQKPILLTCDALNSHINGARRASDGKYYMFVVRLSKQIPIQEFNRLTNADADLAIPTHLIVYQRRQ